MKLKRNVLGVVALLTSIAALVCAFYQDQLGQLLFTSEAMTLSERVVQASRSWFDRGTSWFTDQPPIFYVYSGLGLAGIVAGIFAFIVGDNWRFTAAATTVGVAAVAWEYILIGLVVAVMVGVIMLIMSSDISIGFD